jgi:hypothetical protein
MWSANYERKYCNKKCSYKPKARGRFITKLFHDMLLERLAEEPKPIVLCEEVRERLMVIKAANPELSCLKGSIKADEYCAAARRMVYFPEKESGGLIVKLVEQVGMPQGDEHDSVVDTTIGVQFLWKLEDFKEGQVPKDWEKQGAIAKQFLYAKRNGTNKSGQRSCESGANGSRGQLEEDELDRWD